MRRFVSFFLVVTCLILNVHGTDNEVDRVASSINLHYTHSQLDRIQKIEIQPKYVEDGVEHFTRKIVKNDNDNDKNGNFETSSIAWYIAAFGGLIAFFIIVSCSEWCCRRSVRNSEENQSNNVLPTSCEAVTPPPSYEHFAPPSYESICIGRTGEEKCEYDVFVIPANTLSVMIEAVDPPPSYLAASKTFHPYYVNPAELNSLQQASTSTEMLDVSSFLSQKGTNERDEVVAVRNLPGDTVDKDFNSTISHLVVGIGSTNTNLDVTSVQNQESNESANINNNNNMLSLFKKFNRNIPNRGNYNISSNQMQSLPGETPSVNISNDSNNTII